MPSGKKPATETKDDDIPGIVLLPRLASVTAKPDSPVLGGFGFFFSRAGCASASAEAAAARP